MNIFLHQRAELAARERKCITGKRNGTKETREKMKRMKEIKKSPDRYIPG
jgi:hypothetical protein